MKNKRVAITGMGAICGLGHNLDTVWKSLISGESGISQITSFDVSELPVKIAGQVRDFKISDKLISEKDQSKYDRFIHLALHSADEAMKNAMAETLPYDAEKIGCILGVGMGGFPLIEATDKIYLEKGHRRVSPFFIPSIIPNMAPGLVSIYFGLKGVNYNIASACASASHAISAAAYEIMTGNHDMMVTGGAESVLCALPISGFTSMKALSKRNEEPTKASRPFDINRDGFVMGEGAGTLILEDFEKAQKRGATIYAEVVGHGSSSDAYHITAPHPDGEGASQCMNNALRSAGIDASAIGYINAHGTSTPLGDIGETKAIKKTFGDHAHKLVVSSTKSMTGHLLGAAGGVESIFCALALHHQIIPPTTNLDNVDPLCDLDYCANIARKINFEYALNNSFGFGGTNASIILKRYNGK